ncbi:GDSL-type esterase/lipase family protein [Flavobacterium sp. SUN052]|uniref:GDSL-type esterase/lipase family protein n=1 Tax=Flavobacterium sp. SUN052 TaxID=3002441 RepID=UPI00237D51A7|nr:GDSL-type esterase/lipase family protein [Flavobacterium sp. SUN052]MEC4004247.1 GDSL-type esterase/lipase family protein [Flavobacterium sp. SUN052]
MFSKKTLFAFTFTLLLAVQLSAQQMENWNIKATDTAASLKADYSRNVFINTNSMNSLLAKLYKIKHFSKESAVFVHIGDSHIQADIETSVIRNELQNYFGNAGRGLVFPYQVAKTNAPFDINSSSKSSWKNNRIARVDTLISCGISAFGIESQSVNPEFNLELRNINGTKDSFDKVRLFMDGNISELAFEYNDNQTENICYQIAPNYAEFSLKYPSSGFKLSFPTTDTIQFYGASLEKKETSGVIYHSIGANGAKYSDYNKTSKFWKQLKNLNADCYIISLGTNEAQDPNLKAEDFLDGVNVMVNKLRLISPNACIILTTPPVSYFKKLRPNQSLEIITDALIQFSNENNVVCWDLFNASRGSEGAKIWKATQLLRSGDLVHFSKEGYVLQGDLFVNAFVKVWNDFLNKN